MKLKMDPAIRRTVLFGLLGLIIAAGLIAAVQFRPASILPANGLLQVELSAAPADVTGSGRSCMGGCNFTSIIATVDSVSVHTSGALNLTGEWITVVNETKSIDLVQLSNTAQIFGSASVPEGTITQVRMSVSHVTGTLKSGGTVPLIVPSGELKINLNTTITVRSGQTASIALQIVPHIIHQGNGNGEWKLTPVLRQKASD